MVARFKSIFRPFAVALRGVVESNLTTVDELCRVARVSDQTIRNWMGEHVRVDEDAAHRLAVDHPSADVRRILTEARCSGGEFHPMAEEGETDLDSNGRTDIRDVMLSFSHLSKQAASELDGWLSDTSDGRITDREVQRAVDGLNKIISDTRRTLAAITKSTSGARGGRR